MSGATVALTLAGSSTFASGDENAGLRCPAGATLSIGGTGSLSATGGLYGAGIGGNSDGQNTGFHESGGSITISGGTVTATGGHAGAGIGGGSYGSGGSVSINSGAVTATGGNGGTGIGGGFSGDGGTTTISGGTVTASGGEDAAGIGSGYHRDGGSITISGGTVTATGGEKGAGIGGGSYGSGGSISINSGTVTATGGDDTDYTSPDGGGAGIGGGSFGNGGSIQISGGTVTATGGKKTTFDSGGAGIGGGYAGNAGMVLISGGVVFAARGTSGAQDVGNGRLGSGGTLEITDTAAVFLRNDSSLTPTSVSHTHETVTGHTAGGSAYGISVPWDGDFGAWLVPVTLSYDANGGSGTAPASATQHIGTTAAVSDGTGLSYEGYAFSGWNTAAGSGGTSFAAGSTYTFDSDGTLYAVWTAAPAPTPTPTPTPAPTVSPIPTPTPAPTATAAPSPGGSGGGETTVTAGTTILYVGGRTTLTPQMPGGKWTYDRSMVALTQNADGSAEVRALKAGNTTLHYTIGWASADISITIMARELPQTGQNYTLLYILLGLAGCAAGVAALKKKREKA
jgi:LPXTG-motif cell wall-anchored protein